MTKHAHCLHKAAKSKKSKEIAGIDLDRIEKPPGPVDSEDLSGSGGARRASLHGAGSVDAARGEAEWGAGRIKVDRRLRGGWGEMAAWEPNP